MQLILFQNDFDAEDTCVSKSFCDASFICFSSSSTSSISSYIKLSSISCEASFSSSYNFFSLLLLLHFCSSSLVILLPVVLFLLLFSSTSFLIHHLNFSLTFFILLLRLLCWMNYSRFQLPLKTALFWLACLLTGQKYGVTPYIYLETCDHYLPSWTEQQLDGWGSPPVSFLCNRPSFLNVLQLPWLNLL